MSNTLSYLTQRAATVAGLITFRRKPEPLPVVELPYELRGSEQTLADARTLLMFAEIGETGPVVFLRRGTVVTGVKCQRPALVRLWRECTVRQCNLLRQIGEPIMENGLAGRFIRLEKVKRLVLAALGASEPNATRLY